MFGFRDWVLALTPSNSALGTVTEKPLLLAIMPRVCVDKQTRTTPATKKYVDNRYLIWFTGGGWGHLPVENGEEMHQTW